MSTRPLTPVLLGLAGGTAAVTLLGPFGAGLLRPRTSPSGAAQLLGADVAGLLVVVPLCVVAAVLAWREHPVAAPLALGPSGFAAYTFTQYAVGQEWLTYPGTVERFVPLLLGLVVLGGTGLALAWTAAADVPPVGRRLERTVGATLLVLAVFLVVGLHLPTLLDAMSPVPTGSEYLATPTAFWLVKLMDLALLVPLAVATGVGLLRHRAWARRPMYAVLGTYTLVGTSVVAMAVVMLVRDVDGASVPLALGLALFTSVFWVLTVAALRPLRRPRAARRPVSGDVLRLPAPAGRTRS
ncbi:hypothetical protein [Aquipuribacter nitratireducens]|uniref:Uncharacterized protein n=1 Tax=Aquipuribacter nitratireducens TaxID=650104 RepID=A0ABW0GNX5_9MICO